MEIDEIKQVDYTYLMFDGLYYKIGKSINPQKRLKGMQTGNPNCKLLCYGLGFSEDKMHHIFRKFHIKGEWFKLRFKEAELAKRMILDNPIQGDLLRISQLKAIYTEQRNEKRQDDIDKQYKLPFGKYKGMTLRDMDSDEEIKYLIWMQTLPNLEQSTPKFFILLNNHLQKHSHKFVHYSKFKSK